MASGRELDGLARDLASGRISRRSALGRLAGAALGVTLASVPGVGALASAADSKRCPKSRRCGERCCPKHASCKRGKCKCDAGYSKCGKKCVNFQSDATHCGDCDTACDPGKTCIGGECVECAQDPDCDDGNPCTTDVCSDGTCTHQAVDVDDGINCTVDTCDPETGQITHTPNDAACETGNQCTNDFCNPNSGCVSSPANYGTPCNQSGGTICNGSGTCITQCSTNADCGGTADANCSEHLCQSGTCVSRTTEGDDCGATAQGCTMGCFKDKICTNQVCVATGPCQC